MDRVTLEFVAVAAPALVALLLALGWWRMRRQATRLRTAVVDTEAVAREEARTAAQLRKTFDVVATQEREAAWSARTLAAVVARRDAAAAARDLELEAAARANAASEQQLDELRTQLRRLGLELREASRRSDAAATRLVQLETELVAAGDEINRLRQALRQAEARTRAGSAEPDPAAAQRLDAALAEAARLGEVVQALETALEAERRRPSGGLRSAPDDRDAALARLAAGAETANRVAAAARTEIERLAVELTRVRAEADVRVAAALASVATAPPLAAPEPSSLLVAREAEIRDLEERLAILTAARNAELRRLNERIAALERLYLEIEGRDRRISELEMELKDATETLESVRVEAGALETRLAEAGQQIAAARQSAAATGELRERLAESHRRLEDLETAVIRSRSSSGEVEQLRTMLSAERERNVRLVRRAAIAVRPELGVAIESALRPLQDKIARLEAELAARTIMTSIADDVTLIRGIGPKIAALLGGEGITSLRQIAAFTPDDVARIGPLLPIYSGRIVDDRWIEQARELLAGTGGS